MKVDAIIAAQNPLPVMAVHCMGLSGVESLLDTLLAKAHLVNEDIGTAPSVIGGIAGREIPLPLILPMLGLKRYLPLMQ